MEEYKKLIIVCLLVEGFSYAGAAPSGGGG